MEQDLPNFIQAIRRIPLFQGLKPDQALAIFKTCERRTLAPKGVLCELGAPSTEMFILLSGQLSVRTEGNIQVALINPIAPVGEMGIFTGEPRSATVIAREAASFLVLSKARLDHLMRRNSDIEVAISRSLIQILSQRLRDANRELAYLNRLIADQEAGKKALLEDPEEAP